MTLPSIPGDVGTIKLLVKEGELLEAKLADFQVLVSAMALLLMDDKGRVRINKQILNKVHKGKIETIDWDTNSAGAIIMNVTMK